MFLKRWVLLLYGLGAEGDWTHVGSLSSAQGRLVSQFGGSKVHWTLLLARLTPSPVVLSPKAMKSRLKHLNHCFYQSATPNS